MVDFNSDKEAHRQHKFLVMNAEKTPKEGLWLGNEFLKFSPKGRMVIHDEVKAREIQKQHPWELVVARVNDPHPADRGHTYFFSIPGMPWHKYDENGMRVKEEEENANY